MTEEDLALGSYRNLGYKVAVEDVKDILKKQSFIHFNINEQYSIQSMITQKQINSFLKELLNWIFQE